MLFLFLFLRSYLFFECDSYIVLAFYTPTLAIVIF
ncbi:hypothetical protein DES37_10710 [Mangrovibacter plantisponsor]|uniref:Uncharacterized protein n=1 Tax=Mangrovibacter plantisponsor TaxID=451513 RepID=A0A317PXZ8_9ENTR|nr:hypothetical protein DES37_10710 [Mangrovibacter plantisponsor]